MNITRHELSIENIVERDRVAAETAGVAAAEADACELAPLSYAAMKAANAARTLPALLEALPDHLVRPQAVRFLIERQAVTGQAWGWGDVDDVERRFRRLIADERRRALDDLVDDLVDGLTRLADAGALAADPAYDLALDTALPAPMPLALPTIACRPGVAGELVDAILARHEGELRGALVKAEALGDSEGIGFARGRVKALGKAREFLGRAMATGATLATQLVSGDWVVIGSKGERHRLSRRGVTLTCGCPHGRKLQAGEKAAGVCWHSELIPAIEEAMDEAAASYGLAA